MSPVALIEVLCSSDAMEYARCFPICFNDKKFRFQVTSSFCDSIYNVFIKHMMMPLENY